MNFRQYEKLEFESPDSIRNEQANLFAEHIAYCAEKSPYYRDVFARLGLRPDDINLDNLKDFPLTGKDELGADNEAFLAVSNDDVVDIVFSSGTTGAPTRIGYTERDLERLAYNERQSFASAGLNRSDVVLLTCTLDRCFVAGLAYYLGIRSLGATAIRNGHCPMDGHLEIIQRAKPTVLVGVPSFLLKLGLYLQDSGVSPGKTSVRSLVCIGEPLRGRDMEPLPVGQQLYEVWGATLHSTYASSETVTTFCECVEQKGGHLHPELAVVEIVDDNDSILSSGEIGEVVITPLAVEGMPLIRFRTGDISFLIQEPCGCGRNSPRLGPILARKKQMIKLRGTTLYPSAITTVIASIPWIAEYYIEVGSESILSDHVTVHVAVNDPQCGADEVRDRLQSRLRVKPDVVIEPLDQIQKLVHSPRYRKPVRFVDNRKNI